DLIGGEALPKEASVAVKGATEAPRFYEYAGERFREQMNAQLEGLADALLNSNLDELAKGAELFAERLRSMESGSEKAVQVRLKLEEYLNDVSAARKANSELTVTLPDLANPGLTKSVTFGSESLAHLEAILMNSVASLAETERIVETSMAELTVEYWELQEANPDNLQDLDSLAACR
ncbi:MAG: hypothetical protein AAFX94_18580, partial [Myxococcota bacterium]